MGISITVSPCLFHYCIFEADNLFSFLGSLMEVKLSWKSPYSETYLSQILVMVLVMFVLIFRVNFELWVNALMDKRLWDTLDWIECMNGCIIGCMNVWVYWMVYGIDRNLQGSGISLWLSNACHTPNLYKWYIHPTLHGKKKNTCVIKSKLLRCSYPGLTLWALNAIKCNL